jgi:hypothetical protein
MTFLTLSPPRRAIPGSWIKLVAVFDVAVLLGLGWLIVASDLFS